MREMRALKEGAADDFAALTKQARGGRQGGAAAPAQRRLKPNSAPPSL